MEDEKILVSGLEIDSENEGEDFFDLEDVKLDPEEEKRKAKLTAEFFCSLVFCLFLVVFLILDIFMIGSTEGEKCRTSVYHWTWTKVTINLSLVLVVGMRLKSMDSQIDSFNGMEPDEELCFEKMDDWMIWIENFLIGALGLTVFWGFFIWGDYESVACRVILMGFRWTMVFETLLVILLVSIPEIYIFFLSRRQKKNQREKETV